MHIHIHIRIYSFPKISLFYYRLNKFWVVVQHSFPVTEEQNKINDNLKAKRKFKLCAESRCARNK